MTQSAARRLGVETYEAEAIKKDAQGREAEVSRAITPVLEDLVSEISLSLDYVENREVMQRQRRRQSSSTPASVCAVSCATSERLALCRRLKRQPSAW
jgi:hypothetical protein